MQTCEFCRPEEERYLNQFFNKLVEWVDYYWYGTTEKEKVEKSDEVI